MLRTTAQLTACVLLTGGALLSGPATIHAASSGTAENCEQFAVAIVYPDADFGGDRDKARLCVGQQRTRLPEPLVDKVSSWRLRARAGAATLCLLDHEQDREIVLDRLSAGPEQEVGTSWLGGGNDRADSVRLC